MDWQPGVFTKRAGPKSAYATSGDWMSHPEEDNTTNNNRARVAQAGLQPTALPDTPFGTQKAEELNYAKQQPKPIQGQMANLGNQCYENLRLTEALCEVRPNHTAQPLLRQEQEVAAPVSRRKASGGLSGYASSAKQVVNGHQLYD